MITLRNSLGICPLFSIVKYDIHFLASSLYGLRKAFVGQISIHFEQVPHLLLFGELVLFKIFTSIRITPKKSQLQKLGLTKLVCFPIQPIPAASAIGFSIKGAVSTNTLTSPFVLETIQPARFFNLPLIIL